MVLELKKTFLRPGGEGLGELAVPGPAAAHELRSRLAAARCDASQLH